MSMMLCYEGWGAESGRGDQALKLIEFALEIFPSLQKLILNVAGKSAASSFPVNELCNRVAKIESSWGVTLLDPRRREKKSPIALSTPFLYLLMYRNFRGFYLFGEAQPEVYTHVIPKLVDLAGVGIGYCAKFRTALEAAGYSMDLQIAYSDSQLLGHLNSPARQSWEEYLVSKSIASSARNIFATNIWPMAFFERIETDQEVSACLLDASAKISKVSKFAVTVDFPEVNVSHARTCLKKYLYDSRNPEGIR